MVDVSIVTSGHDVADARLHREVAALAAAGLTVEVLGLGDVASAPPEATTRTWPRGGPLRRTVLAGLVVTRARGRVIFALDPDSAVAAYARTRFGRRRLVVDVHEDYASLLRDRAWAVGPVGRLAAMLVRIATAVASRADLTVVADFHVPPGRARNRLVCPNLPDLDLLPHRSRPTEPPRAVYVGDVRESRGLFAMVEAVAAAPPWELDVVGPVAEADRSRLADRLADPQLSDRIRLHGRLPVRQAWGPAEGAQVGLLLLDDTPAFRAAMPSKLYEYLALGLAVVTTALPRQAELVGSRSAGAVVPAGPGASSAVAEVLRGWAADPAALARARVSAAALGDEQAEQRSPYAALAAAVAALVGRDAATGRPGRSVMNSGGRPVDEGGPPA